MLFKTAQIHDPANRAFQQPLEQFRQTLNETISAEGSLTLESVEMSLYLNEAKIRTDISTFGTFQYLQDEFFQKNVGGIRFVSCPSLQELTQFVRLIVRGNDPTRIGAEALNSALTDQQIGNIEFLERAEKATTSSDQATQKTEHKRRALKNYVKAIDLVRDSSFRIAKAKAVDTRKAKRIVYDLVDICISEGFSFLGLSSIKNYDEYTYNHSVNVCIVSIGFGKNLGLSKKQIGELGIAGLYHDYGKLSIPREILNKPGRFDPHEWEIMKTHPLKSIKTLLSQKEIQETDIKKMIAAFEHHRNYDCTGYPQTGVKKEMNFYSKVVAIADAYDAMTTNRVYQRAMLPTYALKILVDNGGTKFDPILVKAFINTVGMYPVGSLLRMTNGSLAVVTAENKDPSKLDRPFVRIAVDSQGNRLEQGPEIDLADPAMGAGWDISTILRPEEYRINVAHYLFGDIAESMKPATSN